MNINLMTEEEIESIIYNILDNIRSEIKKIEHVDYNSTWASGFRQTYWFYNNNLILELSDPEILELLLNNSENEVTEILIDKLKKSIKAEIDKKIQNNKNIKLKDFTREIINYTNLSDNEIEELYKELYLPYIEDYLLDDGEISFSILLEDWNIFSKRMS